MDQEIVLRVAAECVDIAPLWDSVINEKSPLEIDWQLAGSGEGYNVGGLQALYALPTAVILCVWSDKWSKANEVKDDQDPRGWWGDAIDTQGFPELGGEIWTLFRGRLNGETAMKARNYIQAALKTLVDQGAVARFDVDATSDLPTGSLIVNIQGYSQTGDRVYEQRWSFLWTAVGL